MPNNPYLRRFALVKPANSNRVTRNGRVVDALTVTTKLFATPELSNPAGGPTATPAAGGGGATGGGGSGGGHSLN